jgi:hypothetical protein
MTPGAARTECPEPVLTGSGQAGIDDRTGTGENGAQVLIEALDFKSPIFRAAREVGHPRSSHASSLSHSQGTQIRLRALRLDHPPPSNQSKRKPGPRAHPKCAPLGYDRSTRFIYSLVAVRRKGTRSAYKFEILPNRPHAMAVHCLGRINSLLSLDKS